MAMEIFAIGGKSEKDDVTGKRLFWSNKDGWVPLEQADRFTRDERNALRLPIGGIWVKLIDKEGVCPRCGGELHYDVLEVSDGDQAFYPVECQKCKWTGNEWYTLKYIGHEAMN